MVVNTCAPHSASCLEEGGGGRRVRPGDGPDIRWGGHISDCVAGGDQCLHVGVTPPVPPTLPACNVTIHNRCKDTLANCTKVKQKVSCRRAGGGGGAERAPSCLSRPRPVHHRSPPTPRVP